jgi:glycosyltransferase involved in cell wall biosynthesis
MLAVEAPGQASRPVRRSFTVSRVRQPAPSSVFFALRDSPERRVALAAAPESVERYRLFGLDEFASRGVRVRHNLERADRPPAWARAADTAVNRVLYGTGGYGGDFASILASLRIANSADVVFSTVDTVGIPLMLLERAGLVRVPLVYVSIGLPERLAKLRGKRIRRVYAGALRRADAIVAYAQSETDQLRSWIGPGAPPVVFVPFGVDVNAFRPLPEVEPDVDVLSIGTDPRRDFGLLLTIAERRPELSFLIVASAEHARTLGNRPPNVGLETDIPLAQVRDRLARAKVVALPVRDNSYSGATTVLLQAMAMAKPVVVSRTAAIAEGYELEDGVNCRLVEPGDGEAFEQAVVEQQTGAGAASSLGTRARETVERGFTWERYTDALWEIVRGASGS